MAMLICIGRTKESQQMACLTVRQTPFNSFQVALQQNATLFGDTGKYCKGARYRY